MRSSHPSHIEAILEHMEPQFLERHVSSVPRACRSSRDPLMFRRHDHFRGFTSGVALK